MNKFPVRGKVTDDRVRRKISYRNVASLIFKVYSIVKINMNLVL